MSKDPRKRQKQLEKRAAKRKSKQHALVREKSAGLPERMTEASRYPILDCFVTDDVWDQGIGWVGLSRQLPNGSIAFALFLVDRYCLGVKNAMAAITSRFDYDERVVHKLQRQFSSKPMSPAAARKFVEQSVEYARSWGLAPHSDYHRAKLIFGSIDAAESSEQFEFGKDGKPLFIAGPHDNEPRCRQVLRTLAEHGGPDDFHFLMPAGNISRVLPAPHGQALKYKSEEEEEE
jgi:hypothetical protein